MSKNEKNVGYGAPSFDSGDNPFFDYPAAPMHQGPQGGFQQGFPQGPGFGGMAPGQFTGGPQQFPGGMQPFPGGMQPFPGGQMGGQMQPMMPPQVPSGGPFPGMAPQGPAFEEESYIENILRLNRGKLATVYMTFENNREWNAKIFKGIVEAAGRDHIVLSDPETGRRYLLLMIYLDYITFDEELNYEYPFA